MEYRKFGAMKWEVSALGFGIPQTPQRFATSVENNENELIDAIRYAIDHGVNYLDLGYPHHTGQFERLSSLINRALNNGYRQKVKISINLPAQLIDSIQDAERFLTEQLQGSQIGKIDFFILGALDRFTWPKINQLEITKWAESAINDGRIEHLGFAYHDEYYYLKAMLNDYNNWSLGQFQYSLMDSLHHPGVTGINYASEQGLPVVITDPLKTGRLLGNIPESVEAVWAGAQKQRSVQEWGMRWVWNHPEISTIVSESYTLKAIGEEIAMIEAGASAAKNLTISEILLANQLRDAYRALRPFPCTACRCCMPCSHGIDVPRIFEHYLDSIIYQDVEIAQFAYRFEGHKLEKCVGCNLCKQKCGKFFPISDLLKKARQVLEVQ